MGGQGPEHPPTHTPCRSSTSGTGRSQCQTTPGLTIPRSVPGQPKTLPTCSPPPPPRVPPCPPGVTITPRVAGQPPAPRLWAINQWGRGLCCCMQAGGWGGGLPTPPRGHPQHRVLPTGPGWTLPHAKAPGAVGWPVVPGGGCVCVCLWAVPGGTGGEEGRVTGGEGGCSSSRGGWRGPPPSGVGPPGRDVCPPHSRGPRGPWGWVRPGSPPAPTTPPPPPKAPTALGGHPRSSGYRGTGAGGRRGGPASRRGGAGRFPRGHLRGGIGTGTGTHLRLRGGGVPIPPAPYRQLAMGRRGGCPAPLCLLLLLQVRDGTVGPCPGPWDPARGGRTLPGTDVSLRAGWSLAGSTVPSQLCQRDLHFRRGTGRRGGGTGTGTR